MKTYVLLFAIIVSLGIILFISCCGDCICDPEEEETTPRYTYNGYLACDSLPAPMYRVAIFN
ncbi:MAG: hypothetical protein ACP5G4_09940, partial [bacterium]